MGRLVILILLACSIAHGQECTKVTTKAKTLVQRGNLIGTTVAIEFVGAAVNDTWDFRVAGGQTQVLDIAFDVCASLTSFASISGKDVEITPTEDTPTKQEQGILNVQEAMARRCNLEQFAALIGLGAADEIGASGVTVGARRTTLDNVLNNNLANAGHINDRLLDEYRECLVVVTPGNNRTPQWRSTTDVAEATSP